MTFDFEEFYRANPDPWNFAGSDYERGRYRAIVDALPRSRYASAFEPGCSIGELTAQLATVCDHVTAIDIAPSAVRLARRRCAGLANVDVACGDIDIDIPPGPFDLIVFSEIGYYFPVPRLRDIANSLAGRLSHGGDFVAVGSVPAASSHLTSAKYGEIARLISTPRRSVVMRRSRLTAGIAEATDTVVPRRVRSRPGLTLAAATAPPVLARLMA